MLFFAPKANRDPLDDSEMGHFPWLNSIYGNSLKGQKFQFMQFALNFLMQNHMFMNLITLGPTFSTFKEGYVLIYVKQALLAQFKTK